MKHNSKIFLAVFAVIIMVGSALVPFAACNSNGLIAVQTSEEQGNGGSFADLAFALETLKEGLSEQLSVNGTIFVPVDAPSDYVDDSTDVEENKNISVDKETHIGSKDNPLNLGRTNTFTFTNDGRYVIEDGGKLVLLGLEKTWSFIFVNNKNASENGDSSKLVCLKSGALVCVMGVWFKVITAYNTQSFIKCDPGVTLTVKDYTDKTTGKRVMSLDVGKDKCEAVFLDHIHVRNDNKEGTEINIKGTITKEVTEEGKNQLKFSDCSLNLRFYVESGGHTTHLVCKLTNLNTTVGYEIWDQESDPKVDIGIDELSFKVESMRLNVSKGAVKLLDVDYKKTKVEEKLTGLDLSVKGLKFVNDAKITESGDSVKSIECYRTSSFDSMKLTGYGFISVNIAGSYKFHVMLRGIDLELTKFSVEKESLYSPMEKMEMLDSLKFDMTLTADRIRCDGNEFTEVNFLLSDFSFSQDSDKMTFSTGTSKLEGKLVPAGAKTQFDMSIDFSNFVSNGDGVIKGNVKADFATLFDGAYRHLMVSFNGLGILPVTNADDSILSCDEVEYSNNVPIDKVYPTVEGAQNFMGSFSIKNAELGLRVNILDLSIHAVVSAKYIDVDFNVLNNGIVDRFGFGINGEFEASVAYSLVKGVYFEIKSTNDITGYTKVVGGENKKFAIEADPNYGVDVFVQPSETDKAITIDVEYGKANFSNGGLIPAILQIGQYATFVGNEVSAMWFVFDCPSTSRQGTVMFDLSDGYEMTTRPIFHDGEQICVHKYKDGKEMGGYVIVFNAENFSGGSLRTCEGSLFFNDEDPAHFKGFDKVTIPTPTYTTFTLHSGSTNIYVDCVGDTYNLCVYDIDGKILYEGQKKYKGTYDLSGTYSGTTYKLIGWNDGSKFIQGTDNSGTVTATYVMPARDVHIYPIYSEVAEVKDNKVVSYASAVEIDKGQEDNISEGFVIEAGGAKIVMNDGAVKKLKAAIKSDKVIINVTEIVDQDAKTKKTIAGDNAMYGIEITDGKGKSISYEQNTKFEVTLTVNFPGDISTFKVSYVDENGHTISVPLKSYRHVGGNTFEVMFEVNHFSEYMVQPVYVTGGDIAIIVAVVAAVALTASAGITLFFGLRARP